MKIFIEAEKGSNEKGKYDEKTHERLGTKKVLLPYPYAYGFILGTEGDDGECLDCYVISDKIVEQGTIVECEVYGCLEFFEDTEDDYKVLAKFPNESVKGYENLYSELKEFTLGIFKAYPETVAKVGKILSKNDTIKIIEASLQNETTIK